MNGYVYFAKPVDLDGPYKIGFSTVPFRRFEEVMEWSPFLLELVATHEATHHDEMKIHRKLDDHRLHKEWFRPCPEITNGLVMMKNGMSLTESFGLIDVEPKRLRGNKRNSPYVYPIGAFDPMRA